MRNPIPVSLALITLLSCAPRYARQDEGGGGSLGLDSLRVRILALIAAGDYAHAQEYLEAAEGFTHVERDRLAQMISAAERHLVPFLEKALPHIFKADPGHFPQDTAEARELIQTTVTEANLAGTRIGNSVYQRILDTGAQIWVYVRDGKIRDAGINEQPRSTEQLLR